MTKRDLCTMWVPRAWRDGDGTWRMGDLCDRKAVALVSVPGRESKAWRCKRHLPIEAVIDAGP